MKIYTKTGDEGLTGLLGPGRFPKDGSRFEAYGTVDELNATIGVARASAPDPDADRMLAKIQEDLFVLGAALADPDPGGRFHNRVEPELASNLERWIDELETVLPPLTSFLLPGGSPAAANLHLARTTCRRAERHVVSLTRDQAETGVPTPILIYLNRLSDFLFVLARAVNRRAGIAETPWNGL